MRGRRQVQRPRVKPEGEAQWAGKDAAKIFGSVFGGRRNPRLGVRRIDHGLHFGSGFGQPGFVG